MTADAITQRRLRARAMINSTYDTKDCAEYNDFRELLARTDLDGVAIAAGGSLLHEPLQHRAHIFRRALQMRLAHQLAGRETQRLLQAA